MFTTSLNTNERKLFLSLAFYISFLDGQFTFDEKEMIRSFIKRTRYEIPLSISELNKEELLEKFKKLKKSSARKIIIDLLYIANSDGEFSKNERDFIYQLAALHNMDEEEILSITQILQEINKLYFKLGNYVNN
ncbi:MAG TPA: TerB family tellurite resistance protein [Ignavibacteriales bacterium]|jgi:uncharacterized tellurite resistance protein B-like protein|nr:TerB family tellurite resistance protein [Ignavibacteriales bacterium]